MVSLFDISTQKPLWSHLTTGIPTLDLMLRLQSDALLDMQSVPGNTAFSALLCQMVVSHLNSLDTLSVVILETLKPFPWLLLKLHPGFDANWVDQRRISTFSLSTYAKIYAFFAYMPLKRPDPGSVLMFVTSFHELVEFYRLQIAATHEELLLKHQVDKNKCFLENKQKILAEGFKKIELPPVPFLARENPHTKAQHHVTGLVLMMADYSFKNSAIILILGHLEPKFKQFPKREPSTNSGTQLDISFHSSQAPISQTTSMSFYGKESSRLVLTPVELGPRFSDKPNLAESKITARLVFYNDWLYKSPYFKREHQKFKTNHRTFVSVVKVFNFNGINNINEPVYFHFKALPGSSLPNLWLTDLLEPEPEQEALAALIQNSITSTQIAVRDTGVVGTEGCEFPSDGATQRRKVRKISIPSSPPQLGNILDNQRLSLLINGRETEDAEESEESQESGESEESADEENHLEHQDIPESEKEGETEDENDVAIDESRNQNNSIRNGEIPPLEIVDYEQELLFIEGSDVELTGTIFEDLDDSHSEPEWFIRHS